MNSEKTMKENFADIKQLLNRTLELAKECLRVAKSIDRRLKNLQDVPRRLKRLEDAVFGQETTKFHSSLCLRRVQYKHS